MSPHTATQGNRVGNFADRFYARFEGEWHKPAMAIFMAIVLAHWAEHIAQAVQVYALGWPVPESRGALGLWMPWLVTSEVLHYGYAAVMLAGLWLLRGGLHGRARMWWMVAFWIQFWHHIEHLVLQGQAAAGVHLFAREVPTSIVQLWVPRVELHLIYNTAVFLPMLAALVLHLYPAPDELDAATCDCALRPQMNV